MHVKVAPELGDVAADRAEHPGDVAPPSPDRPRTKAAQREATTAALIAAARELFAQRGYAAVGTEEIVQRAEYPARMAGDALTRRREQNPPRGPLDQLSAE